MASPGFHQTLAAHQAVAPASRLDPSIAEAAERQTKAMRALSLQAFPEPAPIDKARVLRRHEADASHAAALRRARAERAGRDSETVAGILGAARRSTA